MAAAVSSLLGPVSPEVSPPWRVHWIEPDTMSGGTGSTSGRREWTGISRRDIHEVWVVVAPDDPAETRRRLRHELTHIFLESTVGGGPDFPLWLQEGIPCCFEAGVLPDGMPAGNRLRRRHLQFFLRARLGRIDLDAFLHRRADQPYSSNDYAVAWGLTYTLITDRVDPRGLAWMRACLEAAAAANRTGEDVSVAVRKAFDRELRRRGLTFKQWERHWRRSVMRLKEPG